MTEYEFELSDEFFTLNEVEQAEIDAVNNEQDSDYYGFDPVEQGFYDDDPNPYHGDYSEM